LLRRRARAVAELSGEEDGADRWGPGVSGWEEGGAATVAARPFGWAGPRCWAEQGGEASWAGAGAGLRCWAAVLGHGERREGQRAKIQEGRGIKVILLFFYNFPNPFLNSIFNSF